MDDALSGAIAELREWSARAGYPLNHMDDSAVLDGIARCMTRLPDATLQLVSDRGLDRVAAVLPRFGGPVSRTQR